MNLDRRLIRLLHSARFPLLMTVLSGTLRGILTISLAWYLSFLINNVFLEKYSLGKSLPLFGVLVVLSLAKAGSGWFSRFQSSLMSASIRLKLKSALLRKFSELDPLFFRGEESGEINNTINAGVDSLNSYFSQYIPQLFYSAIIPFAILCFVFPPDPLSGVVLLLTAPVIPVFMVLIGNLAKNRTSRQWKVLSRMSAYFLDVIQGLTTLKIFGRAEAESEKIGKVSELFREKTMEVLKIAFLSALVLEMAATISTAVIAVEVGLRLLYGKIAFQPALFILILAPEFYQPIRQLGARFHAGLEGVTAAKRIFEILETPSKTVNYASHAKREISVTRVVFRNVSFRYPEASSAVLKNIDFSLEQDSLTVMVGPSGAGKSTIAGLLAKFFPPNRGEIIIDGVSLADIPAEEWREYVALVPQNSYIFNRSVYDNLRLVKAGATEGEIIEAAKKAGLHSFVSSLPKGYDTITGERGVSLSGGEAQRLALARAFLKDAPLLVLDEPTANLDPLLDAQIRQTIRELSVGRTTLLITHRLTHTPEADKIIVIGDGKIIEAGKHEELLASANGIYAKLYRQYGEHWR